MASDRVEVSWNLEEPEMAPLRLGFIGAGVMATYAVYPALHFAPISLKSVCDLDRARARKAAEKFRAGHFYTDYREMLAKEDLEAVVIQMHPKPRHGLVLAALEEGLHVFIPKPPAMSYQSCLELSDAARRANKSVMVNFESRFSYGVKQAMKIIKEPAYGQLTQYSGSFCTGHYDEVRSRLYDDPIHAYLLDFTPHHLDLARYIAGEVKSMALFHNRKGEDAAYSLALEFENGAVGTLQFNSHRLWWRNYDRIELTGEGQYIVVDSLWTVRHYTESGNTFTENYRDERSPELTGDAYALREFVTAIRENQQPIASIHDSVETMRLYQAIYDAVLEGRNGMIFPTHQSR